MSLNRGKKSITFDLKTDEAKEALYRIAENCDVFLENFRPGVTARLGVDYETLRERNPRLIYCSISSFGQTGPYAQWPGYDLIIQGMGGLMGVTGHPGSPPVRIGIAITDIGAGMWGVIAILSALRVREATGEGQPEWRPDGDAPYEEERHFNVNDLPPLLAAPHSPDNVMSVEERAGTHIDQSFIGSCTNGRVEDLRDAAHVLRGEEVAQGCRLIITPATSWVGPSCKSRAKTFRVSSSTSITLSRSANTLSCKRALSMAIAA